MDQYRRFGALVIATAVAWMSVILVAAIVHVDLVVGAAALIAVLATVTIWSLWGLDAYGLSVDGTPREREKPKREPAEEDARLALLLSMLTPDERNALQTRLTEGLTADGESVSLADLLADQESDTRHVGQSSERVP